MRISLNPLPGTSFLLSLLLLLTAGGLTGCVDDDDDELDGNWIRRSDFEGVPRSNAVSFVIGDFAYVGLGYDGEDDLNDFWRYDAERDFWTEVDPFPGAPRRAAVAFAAAGQGFVGTGFNGDDDTEYRDFYAFDPTAARGEQWTRIDDFPGTARYNAVAFADPDRGYVGSGYDDNWLKDFYTYAPAAGEWRQLVSLGGAKRENAVAFTVEDLHYVCTGRNNGLNEFDVWRYRPADDNWDRLEDLDEDDDYNIARYGATAFTLNGLGYVATGVDAFNLSSVWEYDPGTDTWEEKTAFEGISRRNAVSFVINGRAFLTTGTSGTTPLDDMREFLPLEEYEEND